MARTKKKARKGKKNLEDKEMVDADDDAVTDSIETLDKSKNTPEEEPKKKSKKNQRQEKIRS